MGYGSWGILIALILTVITIIINVLVNILCTGKPNKLNYKVIVVFICYFIFAILIKFLLGPLAV
jgi:hypothetical protein